MQLQFLRCSLVSLVFLLSFFRYLPLNRCIPSYVFEAMARRSTNMKKRSCIPHRSDFYKASYVSIYSFPLVWPSWCKFDRGCNVACFSQMWSNKGEMSPGGSSRCWPFECHTERMYTHEWIVCSSLCFLSSHGDYSLLYVKTKHLTHNSVSSVLHHVAAVDFSFSLHLAKCSSWSFKRFLLNAQSFPTMPFFFSLF